ncbi:MAG: T9SS type A sorting domain-containing protein, partial [Bacteroidia bacterium]|nr:T9SS type A sorting domain-containing protein [Bacteroidia bacterium]
LRKEYEFRFELVKYFVPGKVDENFYLEDINILDTIAGQPPVANFSIENIHYCAAGCYQMEIVDQSSGNPFAYAWGGLALSNPVLKGCYSNIPAGDTSYIYLQVTNEFGSSSITKPIYIHHIYFDSITAAPNPVCLNDTLDLHFYGTNAIENSETYLWTNSNTPVTPYATLIDSAGASVLAVPNANITYNVAVQNAYGCSASFNKSISILPLPFLTTASSKTCIGTGDSTILSTYYNVNYNYLWTPSAGLTNSTSSSVYASPPSTTNYSITVTDNNGCSLTQSVLVKVSTLFPVVNLVASDTFPCGSQTVNFTANGNQPLTYLWGQDPCCMGTFVPSGNTASGSFFTTETIFVIATDSNGCVADTASLVIPFNNTPPNFWVSPFTQNVNGGIQISLCNLPPNDSVCMIASGAANYSYVWTSPSGNGSFSSVQNNMATYHGTVGGVYQILITATDMSGCVTTRNYFVNRSISGIVPTFTINPTSVAICQNANQVVSLAPTGWNYYYWLPTTGLSGIIPIGSNAGNFGNGNSATITGASTMTYTITAIDNANACAGSKTINVTVSPAPQINLGADTSICAGFSYLLDAQNPGATYNWSTGATTQTILVSAANTYSVVVTGTNGCLANDAMVLSTQVCTGIETQQGNPDFLVSYLENKICIREINSAPFQFKLYDLAGRLIVSEKSNDGFYFLNEENFSKGIYLLRLESKEKLQVVKLVME